MALSLAVDPRTKVRHSREARQSLLEAREALAKKSRWGAAQFLKVVRHILSSEDDSLPWMKLKMDAICEYMDRSGLPKRIEFDSNADAFTADEMRSIWREVLQAGMSSGDVGRVKPVDADYDLVPETNGKNGNGDLKLTQ